MKNLVKLSWDDFYLAVVRPGGGAHHFCSEPFLAIVVDKLADTSSFFIEVKTHQGTGKLLDGLKYLRCSQAVVNGKEGLLIELSTLQFLRPFYSLALSILAAFEEDNEASVQTVYAVLSDWNANSQLLAMEVTDNQRTGLWAELYVLRFFLRFKSEIGVDVWEGPGKDVHDFRYNDLEIEVKATKKEKPIHTVHGLTQMKPSVDSTLYVFSFTLTESETGTSLNELVTDIQMFLAKDVRMVTVLENKLKLCGFFRLALTERERKLKLRALPALCLVDERFPSLTDAYLLGDSCKDKHARIQNVTYSIDLTGIGITGEDEIKKVLRKG